MYLCFPFTELLFTGFTELFDRIAFSSHCWLCTTRKDKLCEWICSCSGRGCVDADFPLIGISGESDDILSSMRLSNIAMEHGPMAPTLHTF